MTTTKATTKATTKGTAFPLIPLNLVTRVVMGLALLMGGTLGTWAAIESTLPRVAQANPYQVAVAIEREAGESYDTLIRRAEAAARVVAQRSFSRDRALNNVAITIMGQSAGAIAPLLSLEVNRTQWSSRPDPRRWATYYLSARALLQLDGSVPVPPPAATTAPVPGSQQPAQPGQIPAIAVPASPPVVGQPAQTPATTPTTPTVGPTVNTPASDNPVRIDLPAAPAGQLGLPRSILR
jgi:hypothetical protein